MRGAVTRSASDVLIVAGFPVSLRQNGAIISDDGEKLRPEDTKQLIGGIFKLSGISAEHYNMCGDDDFSFSVAGLGRFRCCLYRQRSSEAAVIRVISFDELEPSALGIGEEILSLGKLTNGLVLVTGPAGSGKSTTLAAVIDRINSTRAGHIITIEDPIEYLHRHKRCIVSQREIGHDTESCQTALRAALRQSPDVILIGEMRDYDTIATAMSAAETGQLVLSTLHTIGAASAVERIIDVFPAQSKQQIRVQLASVLRAVVSQYLVPAVGGGSVPAFEIMSVNGAVRSMILEDKTNQLENTIMSGAADGMCSMDQSLLRLYAAGRITRENALAYAFHPDALTRRMDART
ncbi:MAG: PilT/PilU family type 4a pilus ATPase [Eubacteriales bacterium]